MDSSLITEELSSQKNPKLMEKMNDNTNEDDLWQIAKKRALFKQMLVVYIVVNSFLIILWYLKSGVNFYFWPAWPMLGWGLGLFITYMQAYHSNSFFSKEKEYERLKKQNDRI
jgi:hypothetical protein